MARQYCGRNSDLALHALVLMPFPTKLSRRIKRKFTHVFLKDWKTITTKRFIYKLKNKTVTSLSVGRNLSVWVDVCTYVCTPRARNNSRTNMNVDHLRKTYSCHLSRQLVGDFACPKRVPIRTSKKQWRTQWKSSTTPAEYPFVWNLMKGFAMFIGKWTDFNPPLCIFCEYYFRGNEMWVEQIRGPNSAV